jgi:hypothetical protein
MNKPKKFFLILFLVFNYSTIFSQEVLPKFSVKYVGNNRIIIGWVNNLPDIKQISIQRSHDSLKNYKSILSVPDPSAIQNGFADTKAPNDHMYYRLFYAVEGGRFYFTEAKQPIIDSTGQYVEYRPRQENQVNLGSFVPSFYVYTNQDGYVLINLPNADQRKYNIKFFEEDDTFLFELKHIKERALTLDKANFYHAGWFKFELYDDEKLLERHKFYLSKDF